MDIRKQNLSGSRFDDVYLNDVLFHDVDLSGSTFDLVDLSRVKIKRAALIDAEISADISGLRINGVDVVPLIEAELNRRYPDRAKMSPSDAAGYREAWEILQRLWAGTVERARALDPSLLHERVDGEWSFIETLRHLAFATDAWVSRAVLGDPTPWHPLDLPHDEMPDTPGVPRDLTARPTLDETLVLRASRQATVSRVLTSLTDDQLAGHTDAVLEPGYPESQSFPVRRCLGAILNEEWEHRLYAERDLATLESR